MTTTYTAMRNALATFIEYNDSGGPLSFDVDAMWANARAALAGAEAEVDTLRQQLAEAQALIEASRNQEAVAYEWYPPKKPELARLAYEKTPNKQLSALGFVSKPVFATPVVAPDVLKDAERYRWLREQVYVDKESRLRIARTYLLSEPGTTLQQRLDAAIDAATGGAND